MCLANSSKESYTRENQPLKFLVSRLDEEISLDLANNAELNTEDIYEVLVGRSLTGPRFPRCATPARTHPLRTPSTTISRRSSSRNGSNESLTSFFDETSSNYSPSRWRSAQTSTCDPTTVMKTTQTLSITREPRGTTVFYAYATLYARVKNKRYTLAVSSLSSSVFSIVLTQISRLSTSIADSPIASVSHCFRRTTTPTWSQLFGGESRFSRSPPKSGVGSSSTT